MSTPYDSTSKQLFKWDPQTWLRFLDVEGEVVETINVDMSSIRGAADFAMMVRTDRREAVHIEVQTGPDPDMDDRMLFYSAVIGRDQKVNVRSFLILLQQKADRSDVTGFVRKKHSGQTTYLEFRYEVIRLWTVPVEKMFAGGLAILPFAFLADVKTNELPDLVQRAKERIDNEAAPGLAKDLWAAIARFLGLLHESEYVMDLLKFVDSLKDSSTYKSAVAEGVAIGEARGELKGERAILLRQGTIRFGAPDAAALAALNSINSSQQLEDLSERLLIVGNWAELLK